MLRAHKRFRDHHPTYGLYSVCTTLKNFFTFPFMHGQDMTKLNKRIITFIYDWYHKQILYALFEDTCMHPWSLRCHEDGRL